jgi:glycosyltransferase involved in cell wall biosynthesis
MPEPVAHTPQPSKTRLLVITAGPFDKLNAGTDGDGALVRARLCRAFLPLLERWAPVQDLATLPQELDVVVRQARDRGLQPIHATFAPFFAMRLAHEVPNVAFTSWEYPDVPSSAEGRSPVDWMRAIKKTSLVIAASRFTEQGFRASGLAVPIEAILPPVAAPYFELPPWQPGSTAVWNGPAYAMSPLRGGPSEQPWVFPVVQRADLSGVVYTAVVDPADVTSNWLPLIDTYLEALADRPDAVLVIKLVVEFGHDQPYVARTLQYYRSLAREHRCRLLLLPGEFSDEQTLKLMAASTFQVSASRAEGACLPLQAALAAGRPVIAPRHTALSEYVDSQVALVVKSRPEPAQSPAAQRTFVTTVWHEVNRGSLIEAFRASYQLARNNGQYLRLAASARHRMSELCSPAIVGRKLFAALDALV